MADDVLRRVGRQLALAHPTNETEYWEIMMARASALVWADELDRRTPTGADDDEEIAYSEGWSACVARLRQICGGESE